MVDLQRLWSHMQTLDPGFLTLVARGCLTAVKRIVTGAESGEEIGFQTGE